VYIFIRLGVDSTTGPVYANTRTAYVYHTVYSGIMCR